MESRLVRLVLVLGIANGALAQNATFTCDSASWNALAGPPTQVESFSSFTHDEDFDIATVSLSIGTIHVTAGNGIGLNIVDKYLFLPSPVGGGDPGNNGTTHAFCHLRKGGSVPPTEITIALSTPTSAFGANLWIDMLGGGGELEFVVFSGNVSLGAGALFATCNTLLCNGAGCPPTAFFGVVVPAPQAFDRVVLRAHPSAVSSNFFFAMDDLSVVDAICTPASSYCTSGTTLNQCSPSMSSTGTASASETSGFQVRVGNADGIRFGTFFYGLSGAATTPWAANSTSLLCVKAPSQRMSVQNTGGTQGQCDGSFQLDWNAFVNTHPAALGWGAQAGQRVWLQAWMRDVGAPKNSNLSDGLTFTLCP